MIYTIDGLDFSRIAPFGKFNRNPDLDYKNSKFKFWPFLVQIFFNFQTIFEFIIFFNAIGSNWMHHIAVVIDVPNDTCYTSQKLRKIYYLL